MYNTAETVGIAVGQIKGKCPEDPWCPKDRLNTVVQRTRFQVSCTQVRIIKTRGGSGLVVIPLVCVEEHWKIKL